MKNMIETKKGKCLTEYKHTNYEELVELAESFVVSSQFSLTPEQGEIRDTPKCLTGEIVFANIDGTLIKLHAIIDSSD